MRTQSPLNRAAAARLCPMTTSGRDRRMTTLLAATHLKGPHIDWAGLSPLLALLGGAAIVLLVGLVGTALGAPQLVPALTLVCARATLGLTLWQWGEYESLISGALRIDALTQVLTLVLVAGGACTVLLAWRSHAAREAAHGEFHALLLSSLAGMLMLVAAQNTVALFTGLELLSIPLYVLCAVEMRREHSLESGLKYLIVGSVGSATLLYGLAMIYGATGATDYTAIAAKLGDRRALDGRADADRDRAVRRRARVQVLDRALPPVDSRRLRGRADAGDRVHGGDDEGRGDRRLPALLRRRADRSPCELGAGAGGARHDHDRRRQRRRPRPVLAEADARLLLGGPGRLHARRRRRRDEARRAGHGPLPDRLPGHEHGGLRSDRRARTRNRPWRLDGGGCRGSDANGRCSLGR